MRQTTSIIAIGLVGGERLERLVGLPALDADHWETKLVQPVKQDRRHSPRLEYNPTATRRFRQFAGDRLCCRRRLALANHRPFTVKNANMRLVHRDIEASEIVHVGSPLPNRRRCYRPSQKSSRPLPDVEKLEFPPRSQFRRPLAVSMEISLGAQRSHRSSCVRSSLRPCCSNYPWRQHYARGNGIFAAPSISDFFNNIDVERTLRIATLDAFESAIQAERSRRCPSAFRENRLNTLGRGRCRRCYDREH